MRRRIFAFAGCLALSLVCAAGAFAQVTVSGGLALSAIPSVEISSMNAGSNTVGFDPSAGIGGNLFVDYLLPISIPLSLGFEVGVDSASLKYGDLKDTIVAIPLLVRAAYHFDLMPQLDLYLVGKIGYVPGIWTGEEKSSLESSMRADVGAISGVGFGFDVGAAYYFSSKLGIFGEGGFDGYMLESKIKYANVYAKEDESVTFKAPFHRFLTIGISGKF
jgi:hypothetical protein